MEVRSGHWQNKETGEWKFLKMASCGEFSDQCMMKMKPAGDIGTRWERALTGRPNSQSEVRRRGSRRAGYWSWIDIDFKHRVRANYGGISRRAGYCVWMNIGSDKWCSRRQTTTRKTQVDGDKRDVKGAAPGEGWRELAEERTMWRGRHERWWEVRDDSQSHEGTSECIPFTLLLVIFSSL